MTVDQTGSNNLFSTIMTLPPGILGDCDWPARFAVTEMPAAAEAAAGGCPVLLPRHSTSTCFPLLCSPLPSCCHSRLSSPLFSPLPCSLHSPFPSPSASPLPPHPSPSSSLLSHGLSGNTPLTTQPGAQLVVAVDNQPPPEPPATTPGGEPQPQGAKVAIKLFFQNGCVHGAGGPAAEDGSAAAAARCTAVLFCLRACTLPSLPLCLSTATVFALVPVDYNHL